MKKSLENLSKVNNLSFPNFNYNPYKTERRVISFRNRLNVEILEVRYCKINRNLKAIH